MISTVKTSLAELAENIRERISQYIKQSDVLQVTPVLSLLKKCSHILDECDKTKARRSEMKNKIGAINAEIAEIKLRNEEKAKEIKKKYDKELKSKFDVNTTEMNVLMNQLSTTGRECLILAKEQENLINSVVVVSFDKLANIFKEWSAKIANFNFPKTSEGIQNLSIMDSKFDGVPISWVGSPPKEMNYDQLMSFLDSQRVHSSTASLSADISKSIAMHRSMLTHSDCAKADIYAMHLYSQCLSEAEENKLDNEIFLRIDSEAFVSYFLLIMNYQLMVLGKQQLKVSKRIFISLKNKFLMILSNIETEELKMNNTGILIYNAARVYYEEEDQGNQMVTLIQHLDCNFIRSPKVWEHYFLFRINRKLIQQGTSDSVKEIMSPVRKVGKKQFKFSETHRQTLKYIKDHPELVSMVLKEIIYYLTLSSGMASKARNILITLCKQFEVDKEIYSQVLFLEKRYNEAYLISKIQMVSKQKSNVLEKTEERVLESFKRCTAFLDLVDLLELGLLNKYFRTNFHKYSLRDVLGRLTTSMATRVNIYKVMIPKRYKKEDFETSKQLMPINQSCARVIKLDLDRTCRTQPELYAATELLLYNYLFKNDSKMAYFQGLNFVGAYLVQLFSDPVDQINCLDHVITNAFGEFINNKLYRDGLGMLIMFYILDRVFEMNVKSIYAHMQREGIGPQLIAANPVITVFTWNMDLDIVGSPLLNLVWDSLIYNPSMTTLFKIVICLVKNLEDYLKVCDMEEFIITWDAFLSSRQVWFFEAFDKEYLQDRVIQDKIAYLDVDKIAQGMRNLRQECDKFDLPEELLPLLFEEYLTLRQNTNAIVKEVENQLLEQSEKSINTPRQLSSSFN